ncbi:MAG: SusC/RagA family TonB-linked outer membrane protein [Chitinophagaceae bacterium]
MKKVRLLLLTGLLLCMQFLYAQNRTVTGKVTESSGAPLPGATITATGTNISVISGTNGNFSISVPQSVTSLTITSVGYTAQSVALRGSSTVNVAMTLSAGEMQAVVVTGYGVVDRSKYSGAASKVTENAIRNVPMGSFDQMLQGRAPGLSVLSGSGQPGSAAALIVRGPTSIQGGSAPLYVVDGIPVEAGVFQSINPNDIASVDLLKDATAAALYGSRGAAGVIVVTTKRGKSGKMKLGYSTQHGVKFRPQFGYTPMTTDQLFRAQEDLGKQLPNTTLVEWGTFPTLPGWQYSGNNPNKLVGGVLVPKTPGDIAFGSRQLDSLRAINTDWLDEFFEKGTFSNHEISFSGGEGRTRIFSSLGYYNEKGILKPTDMKRITLRTNADYKDDKFTLALSSIVGYTRRNLEANALNGFNAFINPFGVPQLTPSYISPTLPGGKFNTGTAFAFFAPTMLDKIFYDKVYNDQVKAVFSLSLNYDVTKSIYVGAVGGVDFRETQNTVYNDPRPFNTRTSTNVRTRSGSMTEALNRFFQPTARAYVGYKNTIGDHNFDATVYGEVIRTYTKDFTAQGFGIDTLRPNTINAVTAGNAANQLFQVVGGNRSRRSLNSLFGTLRYTYKQKYTLSGSYRYDGASNLPEDNRFDGFYSIGGVWDVMRENFMANTKFVNSLRIKASYGQAANNENFPQGDFGYLPLYNTNANLVSGVTGIAPTNAGNPDAQWEYTNTANVGIEFGFLRNRLYGDVQLYNKSTKNLYVGLVLSAAAGFGYARQDINAGEMTNKGIEYSINYDVVSNRNITWTVFANGAYNKNEVTSLGKAKSYELGTGLVTVGLPLGSHYEVKWAGVDPATGSPLYYTKDGKITKIYSQDNRVQDYGTSIPTVTGGFGTNFRYKGFEISAFLNYAANTTRVNNMEFFLQNPGFLQQGVNQDAGYTFWTKPGDQANLQSPLFQNQFTSRLIQDASWVRLRNVQLSYTFSQNTLGKLKYLSEARIYIMGQNLLTWSKWRGLDPEDSNNISATEYPNPRGLTAGLEIKF